jgi:hypothetical protein
MDRARTVVPERPATGGEPWPAARYWGPIPASRTVSFLTPPLAAETQRFVSVSSRRYLSAEFDPVAD